MVAAAPAQDLRVAGVIAQRRDEPQLRHLVTARFAQQPQDVWSSHHTGGIAYLPSCACDVGNREDRRDQRSACPPRATEPACRSQQSSGCLAARNAIAARSSGGNDTRLPPARTIETRPRRQRRTRCPSSSARSCCRIFAATQFVAGHPAGSISYAACGAGPAPESRPAQLPAESAAKNPRPA